MAAAKKTGIWQKYTGGKTKNKSCPKCGQGYSLAAHKDRQVCGKCHYVEYNTKK